MKKEKDETMMVTITPQELQLLKLGLKERTKVRRRQEKKRRKQYFK